MADAFISQLAISRIEVYNMQITEKNVDAVRILNKYYKEIGHLIEKFIWEHTMHKGKLNIKGAFDISSSSNADYFRSLSGTLRFQYSEEYCNPVELVRAEILGVVASTRQNLENLYA